MENLIIAPKIALEYSSLLSHIIHGLQQRIQDKFAFKYFIEHTFKKIEIKKYASINF